MATINEQIVTGRKFRKLVDEATKLWQRISFWTKAQDVEFNDGKAAETKLGAIDGITDSLVSTSSRIAASAKALNQVNNNLAQGRVQFVVNSDGTLGYRLDGADTVLNFSNSDYRIITVSGYTLTVKTGFKPKAIVCCKINGIAGGCIDTVHNVSGVHNYPWNVNGEGYTPCTILEDGYIFHAEAGASGTNKVPGFNTAQSGDFLVIAAG